MEFNINLNNLGGTRKSKRILRLLSIITIIMAVTTAVILIYDIEDSMVLLWFYLFYFLIISISFYMQSKGKLLLDFFGKSYFRMNDYGIDCKLDMFSRKVINIQWNDMEEIKINLFEVRVKAKDQWESINLEKLSDDNLKAVKQAFADFQEKQIEEKNLVA